MSLLLSLQVVMLLPAGIAVGVRETKAGFLAAGGDETLLTSLDDFVASLEGEDHFFMVNVDTVR